VWWLIPVIPATLEAKIEKITVQGLLRQKKVHKMTPPQQTSWVWWLRPVIPSTQKAIGRRR
jgi:hypothetical protein